MTALGAHVTGERYSGLGVCHGPGCGAPMPPEAYGYCSVECRSKARALALAGETWEPSEAFRAVARRTAQTGVANGAGSSMRTHQRRRAAGTTT